MRAIQRWSYISNSSRFDGDMFKNIFERDNKFLKTRVIDLIMTSNLNLIMISISSAPPRTCPYLEIIDWHLWCHFSCIPMLHPWLIYYAHDTLNIMPVFKCHGINDGYYRGKFKKVSTFLTYLRYCFKHYIPFKRPYVPTTYHSHLKWGGPSKVLVHVLLMDTYLLISSLLKGLLHVEGYIMVVVY